MPDSVLEVKDTSVAQAFTLDLVTAASVNFASAQNGVSVLKRVRLAYTGPAACERLTLALSCRPALLREKSWAIDQLLPGAQLPIPDLDTQFDMDLLRGLNEAEKGELVLELSDASGVVLRREVRPIDLLARDQWGGITETPHLLAAFVWPNDPVVAAVLKDASHRLEAAGYDGSLDGYQSGDPGRSWMLAGAIWSALTALGLSYAVPPASFEQRGQKIRSPERIRAEGLATCLDSSLLLAACFEAAGLKPVVLFSKGHAWAGVWLVERDFGSVEETDVMAVRKAIAARELVVLETTLLTKRPVVAFETAFDQAVEHTAEANEHAFVSAVDIGRARAARVRPLASHQVEAGDQHHAAMQGPEAAVLPSPLGAGDLPNDAVELVPQTPDDRIARWQRKLLDLSLRNRLLNFRDSKQTLPFVCPDVSLLEDRLAAGTRFKALSLLDEDPIGERDQLAASRQAIWAEVARDAFERKQVAVPLSLKEMNNRLLELFRRAKSDLQEGGANTLFLAAGFLSWKKTPEDTRSYRAPLLLIPVKLTRRSATSDFILEHHEDDVRFNATLLEFLKRDFALQVPELEGDLPRDASGYDLPRIFATLRQKVRDVPGFEVVEELALSTFSFAKFLMWKDLVDRTDSLRQSRLVRHLIDNPSQPFLAPGDPGLPQARDVDRQFSPKSLYTLLPADSSQLAAVLAAQDGRDFVLIGPPGTGKSQTIANIISQCLAIGKTVLFVAEKSAALDVVYRRLAAHGLADAVLELHSSKADRKSVLDQLGRSWDRVAAKDASSWEQVTGTLEEDKNRLNGYVQALHRPGTQGFSVYDAIGKAVAGPCEIALQFENRDVHDAQSYARLRQLAEDLQRAHDVVGGCPALVLVEKTEWSFAWQAALLRAAHDLLDQSSRLAVLAAELNQALGLTEDSAGRPQRLAALSAVAKACVLEYDVSWMLGQDCDVVQHGAGVLIEQLAALRTLRLQLAARYPAGRLKASDVNQLDAAWRQAQAKWWPAGVFAKSGVRRLLQTYAESGNAEPARDIPLLQQLVAHEAQVQASPLDGCPIFAGLETDEGRVQAWVDQASLFAQAAAGLRAQAADADRCTQVLRALAKRQASETQEQLARFLDAGQQWRQALSSFAEQAGGRPDALDLSALQTQLATLVQSQESIANWVHWVHVRDQARLSGIGALAEALQADRLTACAAEVLERAYAVWWLPLAMDADPCLREFSQWSHEDTIRQFQTLVDQANQLAASEVLRRIQHGLPRKEGVARNSELGILRHQLSLQRPSLPLRGLISAMPEHFTRLAPCVLMSPLSVAHYLPPDQAPFDVVIFDEASQITTWDAVGAIARGRQAVIVGDPKQLPPTNFFGRADEQEDVPEMERDLASILDEVVGAGIPTQQLNWHYRSRDESLIAFSNWNYYDGRLVTFPSPSTASDAVQLHAVEGVYDRGGSRTNVTEARAIVQLIVQRLVQWLAVPEAARQTLGVITFNIEQQGLILDLLDEARRADKRLEWFFEDAREEPVIVKNLENIQGDERDVMLFSITYGADAAGKLSMAFGALNGEGGEKRLNVAVTRARRELHVFSCLRADQIDLSRTKALGVRHLKGFLDYAARGAVALASQDMGSQGPAENAFEQAIKHAIEQRGWEVRSQIGVSGYRIDLGVVHPDRAGAYLAGVECDGATYHSSASARDRDKTRQAVLEGLGWSILRIWSTDWFKNPRAAIERTHEALQALLDQSRAESLTAPDVTEVGAGVAAVSPVRVEDEGAVPSEATAEHPDGLGSSAPEEVEGLPESALGIPAGDMAEASEERIARRVSSGAEAASSAGASGQSGAAPSGGPKPDPDRFFLPEYDAVLRSLIVEKVREQGPLPLLALCRQLASLHGWQRTGRRIVDRIEGSLQDVDVAQEDGVPFIWGAQTQADRVPFRHGLSRDIREVSRAEIAALYDEHAGQLDASADPVKDLARLAGVGRLSADARAYLDKCLKWRGQ